MYMPPGTLKNQINVKWLNLQTTHCNLTEKCLKWQTSCDLKKLLTAVFTSVSAATAFTRGQQFLKKNVEWLNLQISHRNLTENCLKWQTSCNFLQKLLTAVSTSGSAATAFTRTRRQQFLKKMSNFTLQFDRKMSQMTNFFGFFTKVTYYCVHFRFRYCCFYSNPWAAILANVWCAWWPFRQFQFFQSSLGLFWDNLKVSNGKGRPNNYSFDHASVFQ